MQTNKVPNKKLKSSNDHKMLSPSIKLDFPNSQRAETI